MATEVKAAEQKDLRARARRTSRAVDVFVRVLEIFCVVLMVAMAVIVLLGVFYRYVLQRALLWYDEFSEFLLVWLSFYGSVLAMHRDAHIGFETLVESLPRRLQRVLAVVVQLVVLLVQVALFYYGWVLVQAASFDTAVSIRWVRLSWVYGAIPISGALMFVITLSRLSRLLRPAKP